MSSSNPLRWYLPSPAEEGGPLAVDEVSSHKVPFKHKALCV